ncbi:MAG: lipoate--protein ligase [Clostridiales bacterium]|jgi:lipoate-protein ligase A|nr:lipoate--protein ligase [Clostridiales bacterium]
MFIVKNDNTDAAFNLALEETLLREYAEDDVFMLWQNRRAVIVGKNQNTVEEIDREYAEENGIQVVRRLTGGGAVYHDLGNLNFTFIKRNAAGHFLDFDLFNKPVIELLAESGVAGVTSQRNDILAGGRKISGGAQTVYRGAVLHHGTLMFNVDVGVLERVLKPHPLKIKSKAVRSVASRVDNLSRLAAVDIPAFREKAERRIAEGAGGAKTLDASRGAAYDGAMALKAEKYDTFEWNYGFSPDYEYRASAYGEAGLVEVWMKVGGGRIGGVKFRGDFTGLEPVSGLEHALAGASLTPASLRETLAGIDLSRYIARLSADALAALLTGRFLK